MSNSKGLDMRSAEHLQIANYGIGGHYEPHFDHAREGEDNFEDLGMGNRIATLLMYTSEVTAGGEYFVTFVVRGAPQEAVEWVLASQETLTKLTRSTRDHYCSCIR